MGLNGVLIDLKNRKLIKFYCILIFILLLDGKIMESVECEISQNLANSGIDTSE